MSKRKAKSEEAEATLPTIPEQLGKSMERVMLHKLCDYQQHDGATYDDIPPDTLSEAEEWLGNRIPRAVTIYRDRLIVVTWPDFQKRVFPFRA